MRNYTHYLYFILTFYNIVAYSWVIRSNTSMATNEDVHPGKLLSEDCFKEGGNEYYYDITPGSTNRVCLKRFGYGDDGIWEIIQSTNFNCPVGTKKYELLRYCYDNSLTFMKGMYFSVNDGSITEFGPFRTKQLTTKTTTTTTTIPMKTTKVLPPTPDLVDITREKCSTKVLGTINYRSKECFKDGGNEYYHNHKPRVCVSPSEVCIKRTGENIEIIYSSYSQCRVRSNESEINECMKTLSKKWTKIIDDSGTKKIN